MVVVFFPEKKPKLCHEDFSRWFHCLQRYGHTPIQVKVMFLKCEEYGINLNPKKCAFIVFLDLIFKFIVAKEVKLPNPKEI